MPPALLKSLSGRLLAPAAQNSRAQASDDASWVWPLRAERAREPHLAAILPQKRQARKTSSSKGKEPEPVAEDSQTLQTALAALREAMCGPPPAEHRKSSAGRNRRGSTKVSKSDSRRKSQASSGLASATEEEEEDSLPEELGHTLLFWKEYDATPHPEVGLPAWREEISAPTPPPKRASPRKHGESMPKSPARSWRVEAAIQRRKALARRSADSPEASAALHLEVQLKSKERLRDLLRTGQLQRVKKEMAASMPKPPPTEQPRPPGQRADSPEESTRLFGDDSLASSRKVRREKASPERKPIQGQAAEALQLMSRQRNELTKARRALEQVLDTRRESDRKLERLQQVLAKYQPAEPRKPVDINGVITSKWGLRRQSSKRSPIDRRLNL
mmetsp:Transcript_59248/g.122542  ORF Transcript_59248/g.122542 Transcript_59248/m.122542 type:complete len:389 (+) Transcript_59248:40-1206(+)